MTRWLITGASGMLGRELQLLLAGETVTALGRSELDVTDAAAIADAVAGHDVVVNTAAYTRVDDAEDDVAAATAVNATAAGALAAAAAKTGARFIHLSTDYVFDGTATQPYREDAPVHPLSVYGRSKAEGEALALAAHPRGAFVLRTAWLYGAFGDNFVATMLRAAEKHPTVAVLADQHGQPTWTRDVAERIRAVATAEVPPGIYHATNSGGCSRLEFTREIFRLAGLDPARVTAADPSAFPRRAARPAYSVLGHERWREAGLPPLRSWQDALAESFAVGTFAPPR